jgi:hypothetical protein
MPPTENIFEGSNDGVLQAYGKGRLRGTIETWCCPDPLDTQDDLNARPAFVGQVKGNCTLTAH